MEPWIHLGISALSVVVSIWVFQAKTQKSLQNGIHARLGSLEQTTAGVKTDVEWIKDKIKNLPCDRHDKCKT